jgi:hypothetical protein
MANPFETKRSSVCDGCGEGVFQGDLMFAHEGEFFCEMCADEMDCVCECGDYKKPEYEMCYNCRFN